MNNIHTANGILLKMTTDLKIKVFVMIARMRYAIANIPYKSLYESKKVFCMIVTVKSDIYPIKLPFVTIFTQISLSVNMQKHGFRKEKICKIRWNSKIFRSIFQVSRH